MTGKAIICLQGTQSTKRVEKLFEYQWRGKMLFSHGTSCCKGVCVSFQYNLEYQLLNIICDTDGRYIIACVEIQGQLYILINYYAPNTENGQIQTFKEVANHITEMDIPPDSKYYVLVTGILFSTLPWIHKKAKSKRKARFQPQSIMSNYGS